MSSMLYINFKRPMRDNLLSCLEKMGYIIEVSDILNMIIFRTNHDNLREIKALSGVISITDKEGGRIGN